jgi:hypothetical protein
VNALHSAPVLAVAFLGVGCNEIVGFDDRLPQPKREDLATCYQASFTAPQPPGPSLEVSVRFVDGEGGGAPRDELGVSVCPLRLPGEPLDCSQPLEAGLTVGGALTLGWPVSPPMTPPPTPPPVPEAGPTPPYVRAASGTYFPTIVLRQPPPFEGAFWPALPVFSYGALKQTFEPDSFEPYLNERAHLFVVTHDCNGRPASGIEVSLDGKATDPFTVPFVRDEGGRPVYDQAISRADGLVGFLNLPTVDGRAEATPTLRDTRFGTTLAFRDWQRPVPLRKGHITLLVLAL